MLRNVFNFDESSGTFSGAADTEVEVSADIIEAAVDGAGDG